MFEIVLTDHAVERYRDRVRPGLGFNAALGDLRQTLGACGVWSAEPPAWEPSTGGAGFVFIGDDIVLPIAQQDDGTFVATTCLTRGGMSEDRRAAKHRRKSEARARRAERQRLRNMPGTPRARAA